MSDIKWIFNYIKKEFSLGVRYPPKIIDKFLIYTHLLPFKYRIKYYIYYRNYINIKIKEDVKLALDNIHSFTGDTSKKNTGPIWIFWWQGYNDMPMIVKCCIHSIETHSNGHKVILINKFNIKKYTTIPTYIYIKLYHHNMTITHFSDILRFNLLYNHGGLWIDSTVYCTSDLSEKYFSNIYTSGGYSFKQSLKLLASRWTEFLIGGNKSNVLFKFMNNFFMIYWKRHKYLIDYLLVDSALSYAYYLNLGGFKYYVDNIAWRNNPNMYSLVNHLNDKYNKLEYNKIITNTNLFKLTYKKKFNNSRYTFFNKLMHKQL